MRDFRAAMAAALLQRPPFDCYAVTREQEEGRVRFLVRHYRHPNAKQICCEAIVYVTDEDRRGPDPNPEVNALARSQREMDRRHD